MRCGIRVPAHGGGMVPAYLTDAISQVGKLHDGQDVVRMAQDLASAIPAERPYWNQATASTPWCGVFIRWILWRNGIVVGGPRPDGIGPMWVDWWEDIGTEVAVGDRQPGDIAIYLGNPHHVTFVGDQNDYIGGNQSDGVTRGHYRTPDRVPRPPLPSAIAQPAPVPSAARFTGITATVFGGPGDEQPVAYSDVAAGWADRPGVALPYRFSGTRPQVRVTKGSASVVCPIVDVGPWNINDPYWQNGARPQAESGTDTHGRHTNLAGIDLTPAAARAIGLNGKGVVDWEFASETIMTDPQPTTLPAPVTDPQPTVQIDLRYILQLVTRILDMMDEIKKAKAAPPPVATPGSTTAPTTTKSKPDVVVGVLGAIAAALGWGTNTIGAPVGETATLPSIISFIAPLALTFLGSNGVSIIPAILGLIGKLATKTKA